ncbi:major facilitator superfamily domain-containing protein 6-like [Macrobrachium rosenbergii]|uniref:major facilitator superfamily domain-containing protein 6-like n=1 Tax=Macrobrachium rosenbergii TaxID=79674 RepID=UPI0034D3BAF1
MKVHAGNSQEMEIFKINKALLPFKVHYFFKNGGSAFLSFLAPMANQRGISARGVGIIWTAHTIVSSLSNVLFGSLADAYKMHRLLLIGICGLLTSSYTMFFFLPAIPQPTAPAVETSLSVQCLSNVTSPRLCFSKLHNHNLSSFLSCVDGQVELQSSREESWEFECFSEGQKKVGIHIEREHLFFKNNSELGKNLSEKCITVTENDITGLSYDDYETACDKDIYLQCKNDCRRLEDEPIYVSELLATTEFWLNAICIIFIYVSIDASSSLVDTMCFVVLGKDRHMYGRTRMFGALGWGVMGAIMGGLVNLVSKNQPDINYTPAMIITAVFLLFNLIYTATIRVNVPGKQGTNPHGIKLSFPFVSLLATALIQGSAMGFIWTFEFIYLKSVALGWDPKFSDLNLLQGLCVGMDCFVGEVPFMFFSAYIIKRLSNVHTFSLTLVAMSFRLLLCSFIKNPWVFLVAHLFHGLSFGVFFANMVSYANLLAPQGSQATMQSTVMAFFTLGKSLGSFGGGVLLEKLGGAGAFLTMGLIVSFYAIVYVIVHLSHTCFRRSTQGEYQKPIDQGKADVEDSLDT